MITVNNNQGANMKILLINGSPHETGAVARALLECESTMRLLGAEIDNYFIGTAPHSCCTACGCCKDGRGCVFGDIDELYKKCKDADGFVIGTPTHYFGASGTLISMLSRLFYSGIDAFRYKPVAVIAVGRRGGAFDAALEIEKFFRFSSSPIISGIYPATLYAKDGASAEYDSEGLQNMRSAARNLVWLSKCIGLGREYGVSLPIEEEKIKTDISSLKEI